MLYDLYNKFSGTKQMNHCSMAYAVKSAKYRVDF